MQTLLEKLLVELTALRDMPLGSFLCVTHKQSEQFVQFIGSVQEPLRVDVAKPQCSPTQLHRMSNFASNTEVYWVQSDMAYTTLNVGPEKAMELCVQIFGGVFDVEDESSEAYEFHRDTSDVKPMPPPEMSQKARRMLVVIYDLVDGRTDVPFKQEAVTQRMNDLGIHRMTEEQFDAYHKSVIARVAALDKKASN